MFEGISYPDRQPYGRKVLQALWDLWGGDSNSNHIWKYNLATFWQYNDIHHYLMLSQHQRCFRHSILNMMDMV
jgi:hypothetical protein